jgi:adenylate cyclase
MLPDDPSTITLAVGFADLLGFTSLTRERTVSEVSESIAELEGLAFDTTATFGGRVVKLIGDEIMFVAPTPVLGCEIALTLLEKTSGHPVLPPLRASLAVGTVVPYQGDYYGPAVNLASRLADVARGGELLVTSDVAAQLDVGRYAAGPSHLLSLKGFPDPVGACAVSRTG